MRFLSIVSDVEMITITLNCLFMNTLLSYSSRYFQLYQVICHFHENPHRYFKESKLTYNFVKCHYAVHSKTICSNDTVQLLHLPECKTKKELVLSGCRHCCSDDWFWYMVNDCCWNRIRLNQW